MFEEIKERFYKSLSESIKNRKKALKLGREDILFDKTRVSKIVNNTRNGHHPYLIGKGEYHYLIYLFLCKDHDSFKNEDILETPEEELIKKCGNNYDSMLWGHIDWDKMFQDVITELSESDRLKGLGKDFEDTLVDYTPYAVIRFDELPTEYARKYIPLDELERKRQNAIEWVHLRHGSELFKETFYKRFSGKTLHKFDKEFPEFISDYLMKKKPNEYSLGLQAYNFHQSISRIAIHWQNLSGVLYGDMSDGESDLETLLSEYIINGREQMRKLEEFQQKFDALHIDI